MMKSAVRAVHSCVLQRLRVQLDSDVHASVFGPAAALRLCSSRMFSDESHASNQHLDRGQVVARVLEVVKTHQKVDPSKVRESASFQELGLDSLDTVEVVMAVEEEFAVVIPDAEADKINSCSQAIEYIAAHPSAK
ncbi:hypothetical protein BDL97_18G074000 [Sphagnum fallax]|jgi:NADH dehydrogenase (ubiquinone) 1 alpha/beta subcomplex 1|uniref:Uncharacterized protein n=2 Tax=Sphagnum jensenii TaxID=128206 RepID=A0ABP0WHL0_9BRYO|nr:hypothetical protein BDL97_18G074000 [Sphagnum fallax]KAH8934259.1 hypothetical protein BDL97_18G074000 [Sphagnum fallax]